MSLRVLLVNVGIRPRFYPLVSPPLGIMYLAAWLRDHMDVEPRLINQRLNNLSNEAIVAAAADFEADVVCLGALTTAAHRLKPIVAGIREKLPNALVLQGGPDASARGKVALEESGADALVPGEGELATEMLLRAYQDGSDFSGIPGIFWRDKNGEVVGNPGPVPLVEDVDTLPFPAYDLIHLPDYWRHQTMSPLPPRKYAAVFSSRGCPYRCIWCHRVFGKRFRAHSAERMVEEIEFLRRRYGVNEFEFIDDIFNHDRRRVLEFCDLLGRRGIEIKITFPNGVRGDILTDDVLEALVEQGMYFCSFALETGSPRLQELSRKKLNIPRFFENIEKTVRLGVFANGFMMLGFPTETEAELEGTIRAACESQLHTASFFAVTPFPNTELYGIARELVPDKLKGISYADLTCVGGWINVSGVSDAVLTRKLREANRRFYGRPSRVGRILRDYPKPLLLPLYAGMMGYRLTRGVLR